MRWHVFGPIHLEVGDRLEADDRLEVGDRVVDLGPAKQRSVLANLLLAPGRPVAVATLVDRIWDDRPPRAANAVAPYVTRLRRAIAAAGCRDEIRFTVGGYLLTCAPDRVDLHLARQLDQRAHAAHEAGNHPTAVRLWAEALVACGPGEPLAGIPGRWAGQAREGMRREWLSWHSGWARCQLELGYGEEVVRRLEVLVAEHPTAEELVAPLMAALEASGRTAQALERYARLRAAIADELGAEPSPQLRALHTRLLRAGGPPPAGRSGVDRAPAELPPAPAGYTGRTAQLAVLDAVRAGDGSRLIAISGSPGMGKTALAVHWAHRVRSDFPGGQIYLNLHGFDTGLAVGPAEAVRHLLVAVGVGVREIPPDIDERVALMRTRFADRRTLIILDNARDADQVRPLVPGGDGCLVVVTSRNRMPGLVASDGAQPVGLDVLGEADARELLARRIGQRRLAAETGAVDALLQAAAGLPLALVTIAARIATQPGRALALFAAELAGPSRPLNGAGGGDDATDPRTVFSCSYRALGPAAARLFRLLGTHPGPDIDGPAVASLAAVPCGEANDLMAELVIACLVTGGPAGRYSMHDLLHAYAGELAGERERQDALRRVMEHYLFTAAAAACAVEPAANLVELGPPPGPVRCFAGRAAGLAWFTAEHAVLTAAVRRAAAAGLHRPAWQLAVVMADYLELRGHWEDWITVDRVALEAARRAGDGEAQARIHRLLGRAYVRTGRPDRAEPHYQQALARYVEVGDPAGQGDTQFSLSFLREEQGRHREAMWHSEQAVRLYRAAGHEVGLARALNSLGWDHAMIGEYATTLRYCTEALALQERLGDAYGQAAAWDSLGFAHHHLGRPRLAVEHYQRSLALYGQAGDLYNQADVLTHLGESHLAAGESERARADWTAAHRILAQLNHPDAAQLARRLAGLVPPGRFAHPR